MEANFPSIEEQILKKWGAEKTFQKSLEKRKKGRLFVFYDGPPTANAGPGLHHMINRVMKDVILRYKTMQGFFVPRKAGWDTHGLPVELQIEKKLGLKSKKDIEQYGIAKFNEECRRSVWEYKGEWEKFQERIGLWIDMENPYITYDPKYIESLWFIIKQFWDKKLFYKDYKVVPYCPRCGTPLSSHELAQGYKTVQDRSVYAKFKIIGNKFPVPTYVLAWTTTPWTLPGNVALAVHPGIEYVRAQKDGVNYILAEPCAKKVLGEYQEMQRIQGKDLVGMSYEPLFRFGKGEPGKKIWHIVPADFVSTEDGTGVVHSAVAYGEEDFALGKKENLAMLHLVDEEGKFIDEVLPWKGMFVKDADPLIIDDLKKRELLFKEELYSHEYPFCWRCSTPLLYYAKETWFLNMQKVKSRLLQNNKSINWIPSHIKEGRMGEWLKEVKDWAFSRERYWGTPLPVWQCADCKHEEVVGSLDELKKKKYTSNSYYILRHGHSERQNTDMMASWPEKNPHPLTKQGERQIAKIAKALKKKQIDAVYSSDLLRTKQTAEIIGKELGVAVVFDERLREWDMGVLNGKHVSELGKAWAKPGEKGKEHYMRRFTDPMPQGESWQDVQRRVYAFLKNIDKKHVAKNVLIVSHETPCTMLEGIVQGFTREEIVEYRQAKRFIRPGELRQLPFALLPYNQAMELDLHRPHIDEVVFDCSQCKTGKMKRVKEVVDVWFDSGAMPFAQDHWPFSGKQQKKLSSPKLFPAEYIVEGIDQTRGWFYTLLAVSTLLGFKNPYKNVISLGHVLDEKGEKMSKSKGNIVNPWDIAQKYGVDASRWYFYTINNPGDPKLFAEKDIQQAVRSFLLTLWNCYVFFDTYAEKSKKSIARPNHALDLWILSRLQGAAKEAQANLDSYDITKAARALESFVVNDLSLW
ncbi:MAG: class I tRNA ligase family protein, partial [Candidatus Wildermuthbacteria bacterium]|nr:class I tRNA ligase family protein [Candidatus Wildermuthbacteria bacterium]